MVGGHGRDPRSQEGEGQSATIGTLMHVNNALFSDESVHQVRSQEWRGKGQAFGIASLRDWT